MRARRILALVAAIWLSSQIATLTFTPVAVWLSVTPSDAVECTCAHGADAACPMHHKSQSRSSGSKFCPMQNAGQATTLLQLLFGMTGLLPVPSSVAGASSSSPIPVVRSPLSIVRPVPPDPPPPRA